MAEHEDTGKTALRQVAHTPPPYEACDPGIYPDMSFEDYLAADAASVSTLGVLLDSFPARLLHQKPSTRPMEDGRIAHKLVLEGVDDIAESEAYVEVPKGFSMSHVKKHEDLITYIESTGAIPISEDRAETIRGMHKALKADPDVMGALSNGKSEVSVFWTEPTYGLLCKARFDWVPDRGTIFPDYKTTASIDEKELARSIANFRVPHRSWWYQQAAVLGLGRDDPDKPPLYLPIWQEKAEPYYCVMRPCVPGQVDLAGRELERALAIYAECKAKGEWPGPKHYEPIRLPGWEARRLEHEFGSDAVVSEWSSEG